MFIKKSCLYKIHKILSSIAVFNIDDNKKNKSIYYFTILFTIFDQIIAALLTHKRLRENSSVPEMLENENL